MRDYLSLFVLSFSYLICLEILKKREWDLFLKEELCDITTWWPPLAHSADTFLDLQFRYILFYFFNWIVESLISKKQVIQGSYFLTHQNNFYSNKCTEVSIVIKNTMAHWDTGTPKACQLAVRFGMRHPEIHSSEQWNNTRVAGWSSGWIIMCVRCWARCRLMEDPG